MRIHLLIRGFHLALLFVVLAFVGHSAQVHATSVYGRDSYGGCNYGSCAQQTVVQTPSGLKVAINLADGQVIPASGYTVSITPLNGAGSSFKQADIYIDGKKVATVIPGDDGTAKWQWNPSANPGTRIEVKVMDTNGVITPFTFNVTIAPADTIAEASGSSGGGIRQPTPATNRFFAAALLTNLTESTKKTIKKLPAPIVYTFPYILFALLLVEIIVLLLQTKRELRELETARRRSEHERTIADMKQTLIGLISHYLRTPLTILQGGAEGLTSDGVPAATVTSLQTVIKQLHDTIETLISSTSQAVGVVTSGEGASVARRNLLRRSAGYVAVWLPVVLVGIVAFGFVYLANHVSRFTTNGIGMLTQVIIYSILILSLFQVLRRWQLRRHDTHAAQKLLAEEQTIQRTRDELIIQTANTLQGMVTNLGALVKNLPATAVNAKFVSRGYDQLNILTGKFIVASHLRGARSTEPYAPLTLGELYGHISPAVAKAAANKQVTITITADTHISVQNVSLLSLVLQTVLDNAVAYSKPQSSIEMAAALTSDRHVTITVTDHGSGVEVSKQAALFQPFFKAEGTEQFDREGMGFSLYLDALIMTYLGGSVELVSEPNVATTVTMTLAPEEH